MQTLLNEKADSSEAKEYTVRFLLKRLFLLFCVLLIQSLVSAAKRNDLDTIATCVKWGGADVNGISRWGWYNSPGDTPLTAAIWHKRLDAVKLLVSLGAGVNLRDGSSDTPAGVASYTRNVEMIEYLADQGADVTIKSGKLAPLEIMTLRPEPSVSVQTAIRRVTSPAPEK